MPCKRINPATVLLAGMLLMAGCGSCRSAKGQPADAPCTYVKMTVKVPSRLKLTALELHPLSVGPALAARSLDGLSGTAELTDTLREPQTEPIVAFLQMDDGSLWTARLEDGAILPDGGRSFQVEPVRLEEKDQPSDIKAELMQQHRLTIPSGEYSGITPVQEDVYAVVHDNARGAGLYLLGNNSFQECPGNAAQAEGNDNEDVVYVPSSGTFFVSSEKHQSIREYTLEGVPTGRELHIPEDLKAIQGNAGFESLAYDAARGHFWTMTEKALKDEGLHPRLLRLQRFSDRTLEPDARYLYLMGAPRMGEAQTKGASAYTAGVSAMTALEDGRLVVLEREVYVPGGGVIEKALGSFTVASLYVVDPLHDKAGILEKKLLQRIVTSALNLANYEGLCLGPRLADGRQTLLLIADSQGGKNGLTAEFLQILAFN